MHGWHAYVHPCKQLYALVCAARATAQARAGGAAGGMRLRSTQCGTERMDCGLARLKSGGAAHNRVFAASMVARWKRQMARLDRDGVAGPGRRGRAPAHLGSVVLVQDAEDRAGGCAGGGQELHVEHLGLVDALDDDDFDLAGVGGELHDADDASVLQHGDDGAGGVDGDQGALVARLRDLDAGIADGERAEVARWCPLQECVLMRFSDDEQHCCLAAFWVQNLQKRREVCI